MKTPLSGLIVSALLLTAALTGYAMLRTRVTQMSIAVAGLVAQIDAKSAEARRLTQVRDTLASLTDEEATIGNYFVPESDVVSFINDLQARGGALGASVEIASVAATPASVASHAALTIALSVAGPFDAVVRTLGSIEYAPHDIKITNLALIQDGKGWLADVNLSAGSASTTPATP